MAYTVREVSKLSGVSVRTLHFYDEIGLLKPAFLGENGYRFYEEDELLRLQQILFFRELGFPLSEIQGVMKSDAFDRIEALHSHKALLQEKTARLQALIETVDKTIAHLKGEGTMSEEEIYLGFDREQQEKYEQEIAERYGEGDLLKESKERTKHWGKKDYDGVKDIFKEIHGGLTEVLEKGLSGDSPEAQSFIRRHYELINRFYTPTKEVYVGLGQLYIEHPDFRKLYDSFHPELAEFMAGAMRVFAESELS